MLKEWRDKAGNMPMVAAFARRFEPEGGIPRQRRQQSFGQRRLRADDTHGHLETDMDVAMRPINTSRTIAGTLFKRIVRRRPERLSDGHPTEPSDLPIQEEEATPACPYISIKTMADLKGFPPLVSLKRYVRDPNLLAETLAAYDQREVTAYTWELRGENPTQEQRLEVVAATKIERNTRLSKGIEHSWKHVVDRRRKFISLGSPVGIGNIILNKQGREIEYRPLPPDAGYPEVRLCEMMQTICQQGNLQWYMEMAERQQPPDGHQVTAADIAEFNHLNSLTTLISKYEFVERSTESGYNTALHAIWGLYGASPEVFEQTYGRMPTKKDLDELYASAEHIVISIASGKTVIANGFLNFILEPRQPRILYSKCIPDKLRVIEVEGPRGAMHKVLDIKDETYAEYEKKLNEERTSPPPKRRLFFPRINELTTRCPALYAQGQGPVSEEEIAADLRVRHVISEVCRWAYGVVRAHGQAYRNAPDAC